jgi:hypothetical protein
VALLWRKLRNARFVTNAAAIGPPPPSSAALLLAAPPCMCYQNRRHDQAAQPLVPGVANSAALVAMSVISAVESGCAMDSGVSVLLSDAVMPPVSIC